MFFFVFVLLILLFYTYFRTINDMVNGRKQVEQVEQEYNTDEF